MREGKYYNVIEIKNPDEYAKKIFKSDFVSVKELLDFYGGWKRYIYKDGILFFVSDEKPYQFKDDEDYSVRIEKNIFGGVDYYIPSNKPPFETLKNVIKRL